MSLDEAGHWFHSAACWDTIPQRAQEVGVGGRGKDFLEGQRSAHKVVLRYALEGQRNANG